MDIPLICDHLANDEFPYNEQVAIAESLSRFDFNQAPYLNVQITEDESTAYLSILGTQSEVSLTEEDCLFWLLQSGVRRGFLRDNITQALAGTLPAYMIVAARGQESKPGNDSEIIFHEALTPNSNQGNGHSALPGQVLVVRGEILAQKLPLRQGEPGYTVTGKMLVQQVEDQELPAGENTYIGEDNLTLYAGQDGYLEWVDALLVVQDVLQIETDVDYAHGDIQYQGQIVIRGDVRAGVTVEGERDIEIQGCVEGGEIVSHQGSVTVHRGINGLDKSKISAGKDLKADYIQDARVSVQGEIVTKRYVARCLLDASREIIITEKEGLVRGGELWSECGIRTKIAGSSSCMTTVLGIRIKLSEEDYQEIERLEGQKSQLEESQNRLRRRLDFLSLLEQRQTRLDVKHKNEALVLSDELISLSENIVHLDDRLEQIQKLPADKVDLSKPLIRVDQKVYPGVKFVIEDQEFLVQQEMEGVEVSYIQGKIVLNTLDG